MMGDVMGGFFYALLVGTAFSYLTLASFMCLILSAELYWPRGRVIDRRTRLRAISFVMIFIPVGVACSILAAYFLRWLDLGPLLPFAVGMVAGAILGDFFYYWYHRAQHSIPWLWKYHSVHHSVEELGAGTGYHHLAEAPLKVLFVSIPTILLVSKTGGAAIGFVVAMHGYYLHSTTKLNFGPLAWIISDNRVHRIHHSREPKHFDKNFGAFTLIWDKLFGTAYFPEKDEWPAVGLEGQPEPKSIREYLVGRNPEGYSESPVSTA